MVTAGTVRRPLAADAKVVVDGPTARIAAEIAGAVPDPEIPVLTIADLGVLRAVRIGPSGSVHVDLTPTYSGCPALQAMSDDVGTALRAAGYPDVHVDIVLSPAWSTDDITGAGREALARFGIAPPTHRSVDAPGPVPLTLGVRCPQCGSLRTEQLSRFGSTACKALYRCKSCLEPFDYFKVL